jgi:predicted alpha/beta hydrolase family esterase
MKQVIIIHGLPDEEEFYGNEHPSPSNAHWIPWLQKQLNKKDMLSQALEMPKPYFPNYKDWADVFSQMKISNETILIGHSCGAGFLMKYLSEHSNVNPKQVVLIAPWMDAENYLGEQGNNFFDFELDKNLGNKSEVHVFISSDDEDSILDAVKKIRTEMPNVVYHEFTDKKHFTKNHLGIEEFPELLEVLI